MATPNPILSDEEKDLLMRAAKMISTDGHIEDSRDMDKAARLIRRIVKNASPHPTSEHFPPTSEHSQVAPNICSEYCAPAHIERLISAYGYANRHPEDADGIARAYKALVRAHEEIRDQALEEAARIVDSWYSPKYQRVSKNIRALKSTPAEGGEQCCEYCDGTGDVHSIDGEWRGSCACATKMVSNTESVLRQFLTADGYIAECDIPTICATLSAVNQSATTELSGNSGDLALRQQYEGACIAANANARDTKRYRWLKGQQDVMWQTHSGEWCGSDGETLDQCVDAAMQQQSKESI